MQFNWMNPQMLLVFLSCQYLFDISTVGKSPKICCFVKLCRCILKAKIFLNALTHSLTNIQSIGKIVPGFVQMAQRQILISTLE